MTTPSPRTALKRDSQRGALIAAAERRIAANGVGGLKARDLAQDVGIALGALYNLVADLDDLNLLVASRTLAKMESYVVAADAGMTGAAPIDPVRRLITFARTYRQFASDNLQLWRALFEHRIADRRAFPEGLVADQMRLFGHVAAALRALRPNATEPELFLLTRTLFAAVHGVVSLGLDEKLAALPMSALDVQLEWLVTAFCAGLSQIKGNEG